MLDLTLPCVSAERVEQNIDEVRYWKDVLNFLKMTSIATL